MLGIHQKFLNPIAGIISAASYLGADCLQVFIRSNMGGKRRYIDPYEIHEFNRMLLNSDIKSVVVHAPYVMNPCTDEEYKRLKYYNMIVEDLYFLDMLAGDLRYVLHPGSAKDLTEDEAMTNMCSFVDSIEPRLNKTKLAVEMMAGAGTQMLSNYPQCAVFYEHIKEKPNVGFCLDTCHVFGAGMNFVKLYEAYTNKVFVVHLNNSYAGFGTHVDRHSSVFSGQIDSSELVQFFQSCSSVPVILETPANVQLSDYYTLKEIKDN